MSLLATYHPSAIAQPRECPFYSPYNTTLDPKLYTCKEAEKTFWTTGYLPGPGYVIGQHASEYAACATFSAGLPIVGFSWSQDFSTVPSYGAGGWRQGGYGPGSIFATTTKHGICEFGEWWVDALGTRTWHGNVGSVFEAKSCTYPWDPYAVETGPQTQYRTLPVDAFCTIKAACPIAPLTKLTDADAIALENGGPPRVDKLTAAFKQNLSCMQTKVAAAGGTFTVTSAWRPQQYQDHFREIFDKWQQFQSSPGLKNRPECRPTYEQIVAEKQKHGLQAMVGKTSRHVAGTALDAVWSNIQDATVDQLATQCGISRPWPNKDRPHFQ
jgi:D-alanyl-D-alanine carboxypeptidase